MLKISKKIEKFENSTPYGMMKFSYIIVYAIK